MQRIRRMTADPSCAAEKHGSALAVIDLPNSSGGLSDDEVSDICRNALALPADAGAGARKVLSGINPSRTIGARHG
jgi:hypothetical protein